MTAFSVGLQNSRQLTGRQPASEVKRHPYADGDFESDLQGVRYVSNRGAVTMVCNELRVEAKTRNAHGNALGKLLYWRDDDGKAHTWAMPNELLHGELSEVLKELSSRGYTFIREQAAVFESIYRSGQLLQKCGVLIRLGGMAMSTARRLRQSAA
jgi:hypothetical protein